jgi:hypothetical protein
MVSVLLIFSYEAFITNQMNFFPFSLSYCCLSRGRRYLTFQRFPCFQIWDPSPQGLRAYLSVAPYCFDLQTWFFLRIMVTGFLRVSLCVIILTRRVGMLQEKSFLSETFIYFQVYAPRWLHRMLCWFFSSLSLTYFARLTVV